MIDDRAYYLVTGEALPQVLAGYSTLVSTSFAAKRSIKVGWEPDRNGDPIVHFIDMPADASDPLCKMNVPPPPPPH